MSWRDKCRRLPIHPDERSQGRLVTNHRLPSFFLRSLRRRNRPTKGCVAGLGSSEGRKCCPSVKRLRSEAFFGRFSHEQETNKSGLAFRRTAARGGRGLHRL